MNLYEDNIPNLILKKNYFKILNNFKENIDNYSDKFRINVYYLEDNLCHIIVRRLDKNSGWGKNLQIILYSYNDDTSEILSIGSSEKNTKIIDIYTEIKIEKNIINMCEHKKIVQFYHNNKLSNYNEYLNFTSIIDNNINLNYVFFNKNEQRKYIKTYCNEYLDTYDSLFNLNLKNMIFICNYLYLNGGYYINFNIELINGNIDEISDEPIYLIDNNLILELLFCDKNNKSIITYLDQLLYINTNISIDIIFKDFKKIDENNYIKYNNNSISNGNEKIYYKNVYSINTFKFLINSIRKSYIVEYLNLNYYQIIPEIDNDIIEQNLEVIIIDNENDIISSIFITDNNIKQYIFKI